MRSKIKIQIRAIVHTKEGRIFKTYPWKNANSLIKAFIQLLAAQMLQVSQSVLDTSNTPQACAGYALNLSAVADVNITTRGIVIGSGITSVTMTDYKLETQITTNVTHSPMVIALENPNTSTWRIALSRILTNNTGGVLSIKEVGLYVCGRSSIYNFCAERTLYSVDVPDTYPITFQYRITITL